MEITMKESNNQQGQVIPVSDDKPNVNEALIKAQKKKTVSQTAYNVLAMKYLKSREYVESQIGESLRNTRKAGLYKNELLKMFMSPQMIAGAERLVQAIKPIMEYPPIRHKFFMHKQKKMLRDKSIQQIVILGAGLDLTALRKLCQIAAAGATVFEIDEADVLNFKRETIEEAFSKNKDAYKEVYAHAEEQHKSSFGEEGFYAHIEEYIKKHIKYVPCNYVEEDFIALLQKHGLDLTKPTLFIWEGNTMYLTKDQVDKVLKKIKANFSDCRVLADGVDHIKSKEYTDKYPEQAKALFGDFKDKGAALKIDNQLDQHAEELEFTNIKKKTIRSLAQKYSKKYGDDIVKEDAVHDTELVYDFSYKRGFGK